MEAAVNTINEIERLKLLEPDWDSYGAEPIERAALDNAKQFALDIAALALFAGKKFVSPEVGPAPDAGRCSGLAGPRARRSRGALLTVW